MLAAVAAGAAIGAVQGGLIAGLRIPSMPVTLATYIALLGLTYAMSGGLSMSYPNSDATLWVDRPSPAIFSPRSLITLAAFVIAAVVLGGTRARPGTAVDRRRPPGQPGFRRGVDRTLVGGSSRLPGYSPPWAAHC